MEQEDRIGQLKDFAKEMSETMYHMFIEWYLTFHRPMTECEIMAMNMYKMMIWKAKTILLLSDGIEILPTQKDIIYNPSNMYPVLRSMFEMLFLFRCVYASSKNDLERELLLKLWKIRGNDNIILIPNSELDEELRNKKESAKQENKILRTDILGLANELSLSPAITDSILKNAYIVSPTLKGYMFEHCDECDTITAFRELNFSDNALNTTLAGASYRYSQFSAHSHPSFLGVKSFENTYYEHEEKLETKKILEHTIHFLYLFIKDFCEYKEEYRHIYEERGNRIEDIVNQLDETVATAEL